MVYKFFDRPVLTRRQAKQVAREIMRYLDKAPDVAGMSKWQIARGVARTLYRRRHKHGLESTLVISEDHPAVDAYLKHVFRHALAAADRYEASRGKQLTLAAVPQIVTHTGIQGLRTVSGIVDGDPEIRIVSGDETLATFGGERKEALASGKAFVKTSREMVARGEMMGEAFFPTITVGSSDTDQPGFLGHNRLIKDGQESERETGELFFPTTVVDSIDDSELEKLAEPGSRVEHMARGLMKVRHEMAVEALHVDPQFVQSIPLRTYQEDIANTLAAEVFPKLKEEDK